MSMKIFKLTIYRCFVMTLVMSLLYFPTSISAQYMAPQSRPQGAVPALQGDTNDIYRGILGAIGTTRNIMMQGIQMRRNNQLLTNRLRQLNGVRPKIIADGVLGVCPIPEARPALPTNACAPTGNKSIDIQIARQVKQLGNQYMAFYDQMMNLGANSPTAPGLKCMENAAKRLKDQLTGKRNILRELISRIKQQNEIFKQQAQEILTRMREDHNILEGKRQTAKEKSQNLAEMFADPACQSIPDIQTAAASGAGLRVISQSMERNGFRLQATRFNQENETKQLEAKIQELKDLANNQGVQGLAGNAGLTGHGLKEFGPVNEIIGKETRLLASEHAQLSAKFSRHLGQPLPALDGQFIDEVNERTKPGYCQVPNNPDGSKRVPTAWECSLRKKYVNDCVTLNDKGIGLTKEQILDSLQIQGNQRGGNLLQLYRNDLQIILDNEDLTFEEKEERIQGLERKYGANRVGIVDNENNFKNPYVLYQEIASKCEARLSQDENSSTSNSYFKFAEKIDKTIKPLADFKKKVSNFGVSVTDKIREEIMTCPLRANAGTESCTPDSFNTGSGDYCLAIAGKCSSNVRNCYIKARQLVTEREEKIATDGALYNSVIEEMMKTQRGFLEDAKRRVLTDNNFLGQLFPGTAPDLAKDLFVNTPELMDAISPADLGVKLRAGGDLRFLDDPRNSLPARLEALMGQLDKQGADIQKSLAEYTSRQRTNMEKNMQRWSSVVQACSTSEANAIAGIEEGNKAGAKKDEERNESIEEACFEYNTAISMPLDCEKLPELMRNAMMAARQSNGIMNPEIVNGYRRMGALCQNFMTNRQEKGLADDINQSLVTMCQDSGDNWEGSFDSIKGEYLGNLPSEMRSEVESHINSGTPVLNDIQGINESGLKNSIRALASLSNEKGDVAKLKGKILDRLQEIFQDVEFKSSMDSANFRDIASVKSMAKDQANKDKISDLLKDREREKEVKGLLYAMQIVKDESDGEDEMDNLCKYAKLDTLVRNADECDDDDCLDSVFEDNSESLKGQAKKLNYYVSRLTEVTEAQERASQAVFSRMGQQTPGGVSCVANYNGRAQNPLGLSDQQQIERARQQAAGSFSIGR